MEGNIFLLYGGPEVHSFPPQLNPDSDLILITSIL